MELFRPMGGNSIIALARYRNSQFSILNFQLVIVSLEFKVGFRMCADRADLGRLPANHDMSAVGALPYTVAVAGKDQLILDIPEQPAVAFLVLLFDRADHLKQVRDVVEALLARLLGEGAYMSVHS